MKVLIAIDESNYAEKAFDWYFDSLHKTGNQVILAHIGDHPQLPSFVCYEEAVFPYEEYQARFKACHKKVGELRERYEKKAMFRQASCDFKFEVRQGNPGEALVDIIKEADVSMVVIGTRGQGAIRRTVLGSVSDYIVHHSKVPVLVCHKK